MARSQVREVSKPAEIRGVSAPVNTYVRPADPAPSNLHQLAEGLAALDSGLSSFMGKRKEVADEGDKQRAIRDAYLNNGAGFDEGVKQGLIPPQNSPSYMEWYKKTQGDVQGRKLRDQFAIRYQTWEGRASGDPAAFQKFLGDFLTENIGETSDPEVLAGLNPHVEAMLNESYGQFNTDRSAAIKEGALSTSGAILTDNIERAEEDARATGDDIDYEGLWGSMMAERDEALKRTMPTDYDPVLVDAIILQAEESGDEEMLGLLEKTLPGAEHPMSYDLRVREKRDAAIARIQTGQARIATTQAAQEEQEDKERHNTMVADTLQKIGADKNYVVPEETLKALSRRDPEFRTKLEGYRKNLMGDGVPEDPSEIVEIFADIAGGADEQHVLDMYRQGKIKDPNTLAKALDRVKATATATKPGGILDSSAYKDTVKRITNATGQGDMNFLDNVRGLTDDGARALYDYRNLLFEWEAQNPNASLMDREKASYEFGQQVLKLIQPDPSEVQQGIYAPQDTQEPQGDASEAPATESAPEAAEAPGAAPESPAMTSAIDQLAKKHGVTPEVAREMLLSEDEDAAEAVEPVLDPEVLEGDEERGFLGRIWDNLTRDPMDLLRGEMDEDDDEVDPETTGSIPEADRQALMAVLKNPPRSQDATLSSAFVDPTSNSGVSQKVLAKFAGSKLPVSIRNNNMGAVSITGDISSSWAAQQEGFVGVTKRPAAEGGYYAKYATPEHGIAAASKLLENYGSKGLDTATEIVTRWSTDKKAHASYANTIAKYLNKSGIPATATSKLDLTDPKVRVAILKAKSAHESGAGVAVYSDEVFARGVGLSTKAAAGRTIKAGKGLANLVPSAKRGRVPDLSNLKPEFASKVTDLQREFGTELPIVSGFRDKARNAKAKGAKHSRHIEGDAVDIDVSGMSRQERIRLIQMARAKGFGGVGVYANSIHLDTGGVRAWGPNFSKTTLPKWASDALKA